MNDYIIKEIAIERLKRLKPPVVMSEYGVGYERGIKDAIGILNATPAVDVQPVNYTVNNSAVAHCDKFICRECGICLQDWVEVKPEEYEDGYIDYAHHEYEKKFCPECGAEVKGGDTND